MGQWDGVVHGAWCMVHGAWCMVRRLTGRNCPGGKITKIPLGARWVYCDQPHGLGSNPISAIFLLMWIQSIPYLPWVYKGVSQWSWESWQACWNPLTLGHDVICKVHAWEQWDWVTRDESHEARSKLTLLWWGPFIALFGRRLYKRMSPIFIMRFGITEWFKCLSPGTRFAWGRARSWM